MSVCEVLRYYSMNSL